MPQKFLRQHQKFLAGKTPLLTGITCFILSLFVSVQSFGQSTATSVSGTVTGEKREPMVGVTIQEKGANNTTTSDAEGKFSIGGLKPNATLVFSYVGYASQEIKVGSETNLAITLGAKVNAVDEVVVVGYGTQKRKDVTGSVTSVPKDRFSMLPVTNVMQAVQGAAAGINITTTSSVPGSQPSVLIRGQNSISANSGPFVVVDGIPLSKSGGSLNDINPNDIASMEILKDASAVAIYGTNGANGVILITTKRGTSGKAAVRYNVYGGLEGMAHVLKPRDGAAYIQKYNDWKKANNDPSTNVVPNYTELPNYEAGIETDWVDETTQQGVIQDHNLSISGGTKDIRYFVSGDYLDQKGVIKGYQYKRAAFRANLDATITNWLTIGMSSYVAANNYGGGRANLLNGTAMSPYGNVYNADGTYAIYPMYPETLFSNPLLGLTTDRKDVSTNINGNVYGEIKFSGALTGLKYRLNAGYTYLPTFFGSYAGRAANDLAGTAQVNSSETRSYTIENILTYTKDLGKNHIDFTGLYSAQQRQYENSSATAKNFVNDQLSYHNLAAGANQSATSYADRYALNSMMGRINYAYDSRYLFTVTARRDGSSVFGANTSKYGTFPSVALGWNLSNEDFMKNITAINDLKIRGSYGQSGNEAISVYKTITTYGTVKYPFGGVVFTGLTPSNLGNADLHWETTTGFNIGVDFALLKRRVSGTIEYYRNNTEDLLLNRNLPIIGGYSSVVDNLGKTKNTGIELTLNTKNIVTKNFQWETGINFTANQNRIQDLYGDGKDDIGNRWFIGHPISVVYDYKMLGVWQEGEDPSKVDPTAKAGDLKFADINKDGQITADDKIILGQTQPKWYGGLTNTFHYKNFHLNIFIQTAQGVTRNNPDLTYADESGRRNTPAEVGYWTAENKNNFFPSLAYKNPRGYGYASDASYTRIKDVTLSYVFNAALLEKLHVGSLTLYLSGRNLYTFTDWIGWDPENTYYSRGTGTAPNDWTNNYPVVRSFILGANISFK